MANLKLKGVNKIYPNGVQAVFDFNVDIKDKEFIVFVGPSGCGKSTTLRMVAGLETITSGELYIDGQLMNAVEPKDRNIAMVFQNYALYPHFTVYGNLKFALKLRKVPRPIYTNLDDPEVSSLIEENKQLFALANKYNKTFKKKQYDDNLLAERSEVYQKIYNNEEKLQSLCIQAVGIDEYSINALSKLIAKRYKDVEKNERIIQKYSVEYPTETQRFVETNENILKQIKVFEEKLEFLKNNEVPLNKVRHLSKYEMDLEINRAADSIDLVRYLYRKPSALSGGQRQRVALGRAIVRKPSVFLMDEPLSNLDAKLRVQTRSEIIKIHKKVGATTIYVTHDQTEAMTMADRIVVMKDGYIQQVGSPKELFKDPENKFVASFIGSPAMNFIKGTYNDGIFVGMLEKDTINPTGLTSFSYIIPKQYLKMLEKYNGKEVILGVRPEDISIVKTESTDYKGCAVKCDYVELLGYDLMVYTYILGNKIVIKSDEGTQINMGDTGVISFNPELLYFFDGVTGNRIR